MNVLEVVIDPARYVRWEAGPGFQPVELRIDGAPLLARVRAVEAAIIARAVDDDAALTPGAYLELPAASLPELLAPPRDPTHGFRIGPDHRMYGGHEIFGCTCGVTECWMLLVDITFADDVVRWSNFRQFHRDAWPYDLGPFAFARAAYTRALMAPVRLPAR